MTYESWIGRVDNYLSARLGLGHMDLPDATWRDWHEEDLTPQQACDLYIELYSDEFGEES